jgi:hypothetical protein
VQINCTTKDPLQKILLTTGVGCAEDFLRAGAAPEVKDEAVEVSAFDGCSRGFLPFLFLPSLEVLGLVLKLVLLERGFLARASSLF